MIFVKIFLGKLNKQKMNVITLALCHLCCSNIKNVNYLTKFGDKTFKARYIEEKDK